MAQGEIQHNQDAFIRTITPPSRHTREDAQYLTQQWMTGSKKTTTKE